MATPELIGDIRIFAEIAQGATTNVYKGYQPHLERVVLVKVLRPEYRQDETLRRQFEEEARLVAQIQHPNVVMIYDYGSEVHRTYFAAEFVEGCDLRELLRHKRLPTRLAVYILVAVAKGLAAAHQKEILHQDIKPSNILISYAGEVKLTDFGMAATQLASEETAQEVRGTLAYMSPEHILGKKIDTYSDIFSLGATFYEMLMGAPAFAEENSSEILSAILNRDPMPFLNRRSDLPAALIHICERMLEKTPEKRYQTCEQLLQDVQHFLEQRGPVADTPELANYLKDPASYSAKTTAATPADRSGRERRGRAAWLLFPITSFLLIAILGIFYLKNKSDGPGHPAQIENNRQKGLAIFESQNNVPATDVSESENSQSGMVESLPTTTMEKKENGTQPQRGEMPPDNFLTTPAETFGYLQLICQPWADIHVDGRLLGQTPLKEPLKLSAGEHQIVLQNPEFPDFKTSVNISADDTTMREISLWPLIGQLKLAVSPWAEVYIDGKYRDTVPPQEHPFILRPGSHTLKLKNPALGEWETTIEARAGQTLDFRFNLRNLITQSVEH